MLVNLSWKNVWRNKARSLIVVCAVTLGTLAGVFVAGLMKGWVDQRISSAIYTETGHLKIQNNNYLVNEELQYTINDSPDLEQWLNQNPDIKAYSCRSKVIAMAATANGSTGLTLKGIDPEKEKTVSDLYTKLIDNQADFFEKDKKLPSVIISNKTAEQLQIKKYRISDSNADTLLKQKVPQSIIDKIKPVFGQRFTTKKKFEKAISALLTKGEINQYGSALTRTATYFQPNARIIFTFTSKSGEITSQSYLVTGIFKTSNTLFDQSCAFVKQSVLAPVAGIKETDFHEISVVLNDNKQLDKVQAEFNSHFSPLNMMSWKTLSPDAGLMADFISFYYYLILGIIFLALAFGIINTMLMAILERIKELGMLMAIGMKKIKVFNMIMLETIFLTFTGSAAGMILGGLMINITGQTGLRFSSVAEGFEAMGWAAVVYPSIETSFFVGVTVMVILVGILSSIIPARKALKLNPIEALRIE